jgi:hypothetical protein
MIFIILFLNFFLFSISSSQKLNKDSDKLYGRDMLKAQVYDSFIVNIQQNFPELFFKCDKCKDERVEKNYYLIEKSKKEQEKEKNYKQVSLNDYYLRTYEKKEPCYEAKLINCKLFFLKLYGLNAGKLYSSKEFCCTEDYKKNLRFCLRQCNKKKKINCPEDVFMRRFLMIILKLLLYDEADRKNFSKNHQIKDKNNDFYNENCSSIEKSYKTYCPVINKFFTINIMNLNFHEKYCSKREVYLTVDKNY